MRKVFISYARENKPAIEQLAEHLRVLGCDTWHDSSLHGGEDWWAEILRRIAECDTFIAIISRAALDSTACTREFDWAEALKKPVLPVAVEPLPKALPRRIVQRQIVDYANPRARDRAALNLGGGLATLPPAPNAPDPLPEAPEAPLSYLTDLIELVAEGKALDHDQQRHILNQIEPALYSVDPEERRGGHDILARLNSRNDLFADIYRTVDRLQHIGEKSSDTAKRGAGTHVIGRLFRTQVGPQGRRLRPKTLAIAGAVVLLAVAAVIGVALFNRDGKKLYASYILAPRPGLTGAAIYAEPNTTASKVADLAVQTPVYIVCVAKGPLMEGPGAQGQPRVTTEYWDKVRTDPHGPDLGFVPDVWVNTDSTEPREHLARRRATDRPELPRPRPAA